MNILKDQQDRLTLGRPREMTYGSLKRLFLLSLWGITDRRIIAAGRERQQISEEHHILGKLGIFRNKGFELGEFRVGSIVMFEPRGALQAGDHGKQRAVLAMGRAEILECGMQLANALLGLLKPMRFLVGLAIETDAPRLCAGE